MQGRPWKGRAGGSRCSLIRLMALAQPFPSHRLLLRPHQHPASPGLRHGHLPSVEHGCRTRAR
eukprot:15435787-Alexandrium_andersonii.AAC.1